jgi:hypothetical protein
MTILIRKLVEDHNITNAAILFDNSFGKIYFYCGNRFAYCDSFCIDIPLWFEENMLWKFARISQ